MNEYKHFKDSLGMDDDFELHTWAEIDRVNEVCDDYFIYRGYAIDDDVTGCYTVLLYNARGYCVLDFEIGCKTLLLEPQTIELVNGNNFAIFKGMDGSAYRYYIEDEKLCDESELLCKCAKSKSGLAKCRIDNNYNVLVWETVDD